MLPAADPMAISAELARYMAEQDVWKADTSEFEFWPERSIAEVLTQLPVTESAAERLFGGLAVRRAAAAIRHRPGRCGKSTNPSASASRSSAARGCDKGVRHPGLA
jgi:hypothetical protein